MQVITGPDMCPMHINAPGFKHHEMGAQGREMRSNEVVCIPDFKKMNEALDIVRSMISYHVGTIASEDDPVMDAMDLLTKRVSAPRLGGRVPRAVIKRMMLAASRAPDHAQLAPYRFLLIEGDARARLGEIFVEAKARAGEALDEVAEQKLKSKPSRAPHILVGIASTTDHPKVPIQEQIITAGLALQGCLQVAYAEGFGGMWRTGPMAYDDHVAEELGLESNERIVGFLYLGEVEGALKTPRVVGEEHKLVVWQG